MSLFDTAFENLITSDNITSAGENPLIDPADGKIKEEYLRINSSLNINDINDIDINLPTENQALLYNQNTLNWENKNINLSELNDVNVSGLNENDKLIYSLGEFINVSDLNIGIKNGAPQDGQLQFYDSGAGLPGFNDNRFINQSDIKKPDNNSLYFEQPFFDKDIWVYNIAGEQFVNRNLILNDVLDIDINLPTNEQALMYNSTTTKWENQTLPSGITDHTLLSNIGTNTHAQIDTHIADDAKHREINDSGTAVTDLWSGSKISSELVTINNNLSNIDSQLLEIQEKVSSIGTLLIPRKTGNWYYSVSDVFSNIGTATLTNYIAAQGDFGNGFISSIDPFNTNVPISLTKYFKKIVPISCGDCFINSILLSHRINDAMILYLNGTEIYRINVVGTAKHVNNGQDTDALIQSISQVPTPQDNYIEKIDVAIPDNTFINGNNVFDAILYQAPYSSFNSVFDIEVSTVIPDTLDKLEDTEITNLQNNDLLVYETSSGKWKNQQQASVPNLDQLSNVNSSGKNDKDILYWDNTSNNWLPKAQDSISLQNASSNFVTFYDSFNEKLVYDLFSLNNCSDVSLSLPQLDQALIFNGTSWINQDISVSSTLEALTDVTITNIQTNETILWDGSKFVNSKTSVFDLLQVLILTPANGDILRWNTSNLRFENVQPIETLEGLTDTTFNTLQTNDTVLYDGSKWINGKNNIFNLGQLAIVTPQNDDILSWNTSNLQFENKQPSVKAIGLNITTNINTQNTDDIILYDGTNWVNSQKLKVTEDALQDVINILNTQSNNIITRENNPALPFIFGYDNSDQEINPLIISTYTDLAAISPTDGFNELYNDTNYFNTNLTSVTSATVLDAYQGTISPVNNAVFNARFTLNCINVRVDPGIPTSLNILIEFTQSSNYGTKNLSVYGYKLTSNLDTLMADVSDTLPTVGAEWDLIRPNINILSFPVGVQQTINVTQSATYYMFKIFVDRDNNVPYVGFARLSLVTTQQITKPTYIEGIDFTMSVNNNNELQLDDNLVENLENHTINVNNMFYYYISKWLLPTVKNPNEITAITYKNDSTTFITMNDYLKFPFLRQISNNKILYYNEINKEVTFAEPEIKLKWPVTRKITDAVNDTQIAYSNESAWTSGFLSNTAFNTIDGTVLAISETYVKLKIIYDFTINTINNSQLELQLQTLTNCVQNFEVWGINLSEHGGTPNSDPETNPTNAVNGYYYLNSYTAENVQTLQSFTVPAYSEKVFDYMVVIVVDIYSTTTQLDFLAFYEETRSNSVIPIYNSTTDRFDLTQGQIIKESANGWTEIYNSSGVLQMRTKTEFDCTYVNFNSEMTLRYHARTNGVYTSAPYALLDFAGNVIMEVDSTDTSQIRFVKAPLNTLSGSSSYTIPAF
jgi:hypothetical protein